MLNEQKNKVLVQITSDFSRDEIAWICGYLTEFVAQKNDKKLALENSQNRIENFTLLYVSETGNAKFLALEISKELKKLSLKASVKAASQYQIKNLAKEKNLILITSTHGDGEIPEAGKDFFAQLQTQENLAHLNFLVIGLGDKSYPLFCKAADDFDQQFRALKANSLAPTIKLDVNFEEQISELITQISQLKNDQKNEIIIKKSSASQAQDVRHKSAEVIANINLNDDGSSKETHHIELKIDDEISYEAGDAVAILLDEKEFGDGQKIAPRLYSITSSLNQNEGELHILVSLVRYFNQQNQEVFGLCSNYLSQLKIGDQVKFHISKNRNFKLPDDEKDIVMIGAGTGVAPFRAFLEERDFRGATGKNWLIFGERNFASDFLYQTQWQDYLSSDLLTRMDVAFSRDQKEKIYVQNRIKENAQEIFSWFANGAYFYVCGDKENMAREVEDALVFAIAEYGDKTTEQAALELKESERFLLDVY